MDETEGLLTIDGGRLRGVLAPAIIEQMEQVTGKKAKGIFDCFYGTSTGAILAAGPARGMSAGDLKEFCVGKGTDIFEKLPFLKIVRRLLYWAYSKENLERKLKEVFGEAKLFDIEPFLSIQTKDTATSTVIFFNNFPYTRSKHPDKNLPLWRIIRGITAAAPTYFKSELNRHIDGGISAHNNPSYASYIGPTEYLGLAG
jgi:patatin-like phospholipase/acyl hydrolase